MLQAQGIRLAPNASATKVAYLLDTYDYGRTRDLVFGTVDTWIIWQLTEGAGPRHRCHQRLRHRLGPTSTGPVGTPRSWRPSASRPPCCPPSSTPRPNRAAAGDGVRRPRAGPPAGPPRPGPPGRPRPTAHHRHRRGPAGIAGRARAAPGPAWPRRPSAPAACSTCACGAHPGFAYRGEGGCFPIAAWRRHGFVTWGIEAISLSAGTAVEWLRDDLGLIATAAAVRGGGRPMRRQRGGVLRPRPARPGHARHGTSAPGAPCSG